MNEKIICIGNWRTGILDGAGYVHLVKKIKTKVISTQGKTEQIRIGSKTKYLLSRKITKVDNKPIEIILNDNKSELFATVFPNLFLSLYIESKYLISF